MKKPAGVTPSASSCDCRLDFRFRRDLTQACIGLVTEALIAIRELKVLRHPGMGRY
jgi:hypothetical protein